MALKTDYKNDIPKTPLRKYNMIQNADGTVSFEEVTEFLQIGDSFGAGDINTTNEAVNRKVESTDIVNHNLATEPGFAADALDVKNQFDEQNKKFEWNLVGSATGTKSISLPSDFKELFIVVIDNGNRRYTKIIPKFIISDDLYVFNIGGGYSGNIYGTYAVVSMTSQSIKIHEVSVSSSNVTSSSKLNVYYR